MMHYLQTITVSYEIVFVMILKNQEMNPESDAILLRITLNSNQKLSDMLPSFELNYFADKVHIHRWPQNSPIWDDSTKKQFVESINSNPGKKQIIIKDNYLKIGDFEFTSLKKIGVSVPFFKKECTMILEAQYGKFFAHVHITTKSEDYLEIFNKLISWTKSFSKT